MGELLTVLVPTYNRHVKLRRLLGYVASLEVPYRIVVLDSSSDEPDPGLLSGRVVALDVEHRRYPSSTPPMEKLHDALAGVKSPYVVVWDDDDFLVPRSLTLGVQFLQTHEEYSAVHGQSALFAVDTSDGRKAPWCMPYLQRAFTEETGGERLHSYLRRQTVLNSAVQPTARLASNVEICCSRGFGYVWAELALGSLAIIQGKVAKMDRLYLLKESHGGPDAWIASLMKERHPGTSSWQEPRTTIDVFDWLTDPGFAEKYERFRDCLVVALSRHDGLDLGAARSLVKQAFWFYVAKCLTDKWVKQFGQRGGGLKGWVRALVGRVPALRPAWRKGRIVLPRRRRDLSVPALLRASSPYHRDFLPIYRAVHGEEGRGQSAGRAGSVRVRS